jgi:hypothetical protein
MAEWIVSDTVLAGNLRFHTPNLTMDLLVVRHLCKEQYLEEKARLAYWILP